MGGSVDKNLKDLRQAIEHEARVRQDEVLQVKSDASRLQGSLEAESHQLQKLISDVGERTRALGEALAIETKERVGADNECMKLVLHTKDLVEREITERKLRDDEFGRQMGEVISELERERNEREREDALLKGAINSVKQELSVEREERTSADTRAERQHNDLKAATDADRAKNDATMSALDNGLHAVRQAQEQEKKERV